MAFVQETSGGRLSYLHTDFDTSNTWIMGSNPAVETFHGFFPPPPPPLSFAFLCFYRILVGQTSVTRTLVNA
jgi:hypothetical protein